MNAVGTLVSWPWQAHAVPIPYLHHHCVLPFCCCVCSSRPVTHSNSLLPTAPKAANSIRGPVYPSLLIKEQNGKGMMRGVQFSPRGATENAGRCLMLKPIFYYREIPPPQPKFPTEGPNSSGLRGILPGPRQLEDRIRKIRLSRAGCAAKYNKLSWEMAVRGCLKRKLKICMKW